MPYFLPPASHCSIPEMARRQMEIFSEAVLLATLQPPQPPKHQEWRDLMDAMSAVSCKGEHTLRTQGFE